MGCPMKLTKAFGAAIGLLMLGACTTHYIDDQLGPVESQAGTGSAFAQNLHKGYSQLARTLQQSGHLSYALFWNDKSAKAAAGTEVAPENPDVQGMLPKHPADLAFAKQNQARLNAQLNGGGKTRDPVDMALAQVGFDCMVIHWEKDIYGAIFAACQKQFDDAMAKLEAKPAAMAPMAPPAQDFWVYFDFNRSIIRADAARVLDAVVDSIKKLGVKSLLLTGHTDTVGSVAYNQRLSERRAASAKAYLAKHGVPAGEITTVGKGKTDLRVPTPDQVREQENRNVHIELK